MAAAVADNGGHARVFSRATAQHGLERDRTGGLAHAQAQLLGQG